MLSGMKSGLAFASLVLGALVLVEGFDRCLFRRRRVNECPEWRSITENVTEEYRCPCEEKQTQEDTGEDNWLHWRRKRHAWSFRFRFTFGPRRRRCWCQREVPVTHYYCEKKCCEGFKRDRSRRNKCTIQIENPERLTGCENGGSVTTLNGKEFCTCLSGFTGTACETATCRRPCRNGGRCDDMLEKPACVCQSGFIGEFCERPSCTCENGGKCVTDNYLPVCLCREGFTGDKCQYIERNGTCPSPPTENKFCREDCSNDGACQSPQKCCDSGCGRICSLPEEQVCKYGDHKARIGETFNPSPCKECTCVNPDPGAPDGGALCAVMDCPRIVNCSRTTTDPEECCPRCADPRPVPTADPSYREPHFKNCPNKLVILDLGAVGSVVRMPIELVPVAVTYKDVNLKVNLSKVLFKAGSGEENFHSVIATSERDDRGNFARCQFFIRVRDPIRPVFNSCPADIDTQEGSRVEWDAPTASDNVGLVSDPILVSRIPAGNIFPVGEHTVVYAIEDLEGNTATCDFIVSVYKSGLLEGGDDDDGDVPPEKKKHSGPSSKLHAILIGACAAILFLIIVVVAVGCFCRQRRKKMVERHHSHRRRHDHHGHHHHHHNDNSYDNAVYNVPFGGAQALPPSYDNMSIKEAPPKYSLEDEYEKMSPPSDNGNNAYDNATYNADGEDAVSSVTENSRNQARE